MFIADRTSLRENFIPNPNKEERNMRKGNHVIVDC